MHEVSKVYPNGTEALKALDLTIYPGEHVVILGHNGSGKSTLFRCLTGFENITSGFLEIDGKNPSQLKKRKERSAFRRNIGLVFQHYHLTQNLSVLQNVLFGALGRQSFRKVCAPIASLALRNEAMEALERVGMESVAGNGADELSGGQKQRVAIARMIMQRPRMIMADEPIASLDPKAGKEIMDLLVSICKENQLTFISILHQTDIALQYGERIIGLNQGEVQLDKPVPFIQRSELHELYMSSQEQKEERLEGVVGYGI
ncbi:ATP-binding cassette domain-containing protein [Salicibibacter kimchii]|uniref:ATP-binding cassette domain-containing protein n=2 Tax=Salicibibacter kimchii TaxID=2099786 RepID=A0A345C3X9_9BACI|nr:ATP-binding cassette domain-containing protein [Salicibibacter kimchii]